MPTSLVGKSYGDGTNDLGLNPIYISACLAPYAQEENSDCTKSQRPTNPTNVTTTRTHHCFRDIMINIQKHHIHAFYILVANGIALFLTHSLLSSL